MLRQNRRRSHTEKSGSKSVSLHNQVLSQHPRDQYRRRSCLFVQAHMRPISHFSSQPPPFSRAQHGIKGLLRRPEVGEMHWGALPYRRPQGVCKPYKGLLFRQFT